VVNILVAFGVGALLGGVVGHFAGCEGGSCPLLSSWWRGAIYGGVFGLAVFFLMAGRVE